MAVHRWSETTLYKHRLAGDDRSIIIWFTFIKSTGKPRWPIEDFSLLRRFLSYLELNEQDMQLPQDNQTKQDNDREQSSAAKPSSKVKQGEEEKKAY